jgi:hypothetical protein
MTYLEVKKMKRDPQKDLSYIYWIQRVMEAEKLLKESLDFFDNCYADEIEFRARVKEFLGGE